MMSPWGEEKKDLRVNHAPEETMPVGTIHKRKTTEHTTSLNLRGTSMLLRSAVFRGKKTRLDFMQEKKVGAECLPSWRGHHLSKAKGGTARRGSEKGRASSGGKKMNLERALATYRLYSKKGRRRGDIGRPKKGYIS